MADRDEQVSSLSEDEIPHTLDSFITTLMMLRDMRYMRLTWMVRSDMSTACGMERGTDMFVLFAEKDT